MRIAAACGDMIEHTGERPSPFFLELLSRFGPHGKYSKLGPASIILVIVKFLKAIIAD